MDKKIINFDDTKNDKYKFHQYKSPNLIDNIDTNKIAVQYLTSSLSVERIINILLAAKMLKK